MNGPGFALALVAVGGLAPGPAPGQGGASTPPPPRTVTVTAGPEYRAGWLHRVLFGRHYRDLWTTPIEVELLDLRVFAGGLTPLRRGGGAQTRALRLAGGDGREYVFRSVNKHPSWLPPDLRETIAERVVRDQISVLHPGAALVAAPLVGAAGVLHAQPYLVVLPDDPRLGDFRSEFAGMLGILEERPREGPGGASGFAGASDVAGTDRLLELLRSGGRRADGVAVLAGGRGPLAEVVALARRAGVKVSYRTREQLTAMAGTDRHPLLVQDLGQGTRAILHDQGDRRPTLSGGRPQVEQFQRVAQVVGAGLLAQPGPLERGDSHVLGLCDEENRECGTAGGTAAPDHGRRDVAPRHPRAHGACRIG